MNKARKRYNWKSRQVVETEIDETATKKIKVDLSDVKAEQYDPSNALVLPSKKRTTKIKNKLPEHSVKPLSRKQKKRLQKIVASKEKKQSRAKLFEELAKVQATKEDMKLFVATANMQTKGFKKHSMEQVGLLTSTGKLKSVRGSNKVSKVDRMQLQAVEESSDESSECDSSDENQDEGESSKDKMEVDVAEITQEELPGSDEQCDESNTADQRQIKSDVQTGVPKVKESNNCDIAIAPEPKVISRVTVFNPVNRTPEIQDARLKLPILAEEQVIMEAIHETPIVIVTGETGSGKTTQVPQFLYEAGYTNDRQMIGITEPRRVAAITMSSRVGEEMGFSADKVSYQIRYEGNATENTEIKFMTDGVLLEEMKRDPSLSRYSVIIIDEAHERSVYTDILIGMLSRIVPWRNENNKPLKLVIMSATLRVDDFTKNSRLFKSVPPVVNVSSRQFDVKVHFSKNTPENYVDEAFKKACKIHRKLPAGGILIFLTGQQEVNILCGKLRRMFPLTQDQRWASKKHCKGASITKKASDKDTSATGKENMKEGKVAKPSQPDDMILPKINLEDYAVTPNEEDDTIYDVDDGSDIGDLFSEDDELDEKDAKSFRLEPEEPMYVLPMYAMLPPYKQAQVFQPPPEGCRLCVVATNVAETSITIPNIKYVIDSGKVKTCVYDRITGVSTFQVVWTSKAAAMQRAGRAGRTASGHCYRLYSSAVFNDEFANFAPPEICRRPIDDVVLKLKNMNFHKVLNFPFPTPIDEESLKASERRLTLLGALKPPCQPRTFSDSNKTQFSARITKLGRAMACFALAPRYSKMMALSHQHDLLPYVICIVAALTVQEVLQETHTVAHSVQEKVALKGQKAYWMQIRRTWAGQANSLALGDVMVLLKAVGAAEYDGCSQHFCQQHGLRYKAMLEIRKLRNQLTNKVNEVLPGANLYIDPKMRPPTDSQANLLRQILLAGLPDCIARKVPEDEIKGDSEEKRKWRNAYKATNIEEPVFLHPNSVLFRELPAFVVYQEIFETKKMFMRGIAAIEPEWIMHFFPKECNFAKPLTEPGPRFDESTGTVKCFMSASFGRCAWQLPATELEYPEGEDRFRWFARFLLEGEVCPRLQKFTNQLLIPPSTMIKFWASLQSRTGTLLKALISKNVSSKQRLVEEWETDKTYLLREYLEWVPESDHFSVEKSWPPLE